MSESSISSAVQKPLYRCMAKGVKGAAESYEYGMSWVMSRRAFLHVYEDRLECGDWTLPYQTFSQATLFKTRQMFIPCYILKIKTDSAAYQFGLNAGSFWSGELPFPVTREEGRLSYSKFSIAIRVMVIASLIWYFFLRSP